MLTELRIQNFKSWADTGPMRFAPITGFFGANSSGKTSILQFLLMLKQTVETTDRTRALNFGDNRSLIDLGTFSDVIHNHKGKTILSFSLAWSLEDKTSRQLEAFFFQQKPKDEVLVREINYRAYEISHEFPARHLAWQPGGSYTYFEKSGREDAVRVQNLPRPLHFYGFPKGTHLPSDNPERDVDTITVEELFEMLYYLGPLREYPHRTYLWGGEKPRDVGLRGEFAVHALIASQSNGVSKKVAHWLKHMELIHSFFLQPVAPGRREYEVKIKHAARSPEVLLTEVGFGISQVLPVITLCYYVPEGSILILEQPEIHLHPSVQSALADVFIDAIKTRNIQIILESHSEHLLRRLQRRIAEGALGADQTALYFCEMQDGASQLTTLQLDAFGNITNWPRDFFGDEVGDLAAMAHAEMKRQKAQ